MVIATIVVGNLAKLDRKLIVDDLKNAHDRNITSCRYKPYSKHKAIIVVGIKEQKIFVVGGEQTIRDFVDELKKKSDKVEIIWDWNSQSSQSNLIDYGFPSNIPATLKLGNKV